jgi:hypothetical protein
MNYKCKKIKEGQKFLAEREVLYFKKGPAKYPLTI